MKKSEFTYDNSSPYGEPFDNIIPVQMLYFCFCDFVTEIFSETGYNIVVQGKLVK